MLGLRGVGKTTLILQLYDYLLKEKKILKVIGFYLRSERIL